MKPTHRTWTIALGLLGLSAVAAAWLFLAPAQVGGSTIYSITEGSSMQPLLHKDDLALLRSQSSYHVGDVVLYESPVLHRPVLHRILVIQNGHYFFKGDNNDFVDPGYATRSELVGKLWLRAPGAGRVVGWLGKPFHAALFAALIAMLVLLGGRPLARSRRTRRGEPKAAKAPRAARPSSVAITDVTKASIAASVLLLMAAAIVLVLGFTTPLHRSAPLENAYRHSGTFSYSARVSGGALEYPGGFARTGQPLFTSLIKSVTIRFRYRFESKLPHRVHGSVRMVASLLSQSTNWKQLYDIAKPMRFTGDSAVSGGPVVINGLAALLTELSAASGSSGDTFAVDLQPIVHVEGVVGGHTINQTFSPILPFSVTAAVIKLDVAPPSTPPGATYVPPTADEALSSALDPVESGTVDHRVPNFVSVARYRITVTAARIAGFTLVLLALLAAALSAEQLRRRHTSWPLEAQIAAHFGCLLVPVDSQGHRDESTPVAVHDFESLARLAQYLERPILQHVGGGGSYAVDDGSCHYVYEAHAQALSVRASPLAVRKPARRLAARRRGRLVLLGGVGVLVVAVTLATSFTASTSVPTTNAGASSVALQISQLAPDGCGSLSLTRIVIATGNYTNTASNALVLGTSAVDNISDNGAHNCIIGGAGADHINGKTGDYCQIGPTTGAKYNSCSTF